MKSIFAGKYQVGLKHLAIWFPLALLFVACAPDSSNTIPENPETTRAVELRVVTSGGFAAAYDVLKDQIEADLGISLHTEYGSSSGGSVDSIPMRLAREEDFDVIILSRSSLDKLTEKGLVDPDSRIDLVRSSIGMAVKEGADIPDISTTELFIKTLMDAESIGYSASASGTYLSTVLWPRMQLWETLEPKSTRVLSERVASVVARGELEIGFQQISEILPVEGVSFAGAIPDELQKVTTFSAGILNKASAPEHAKRLLARLSSVELAPQIEATGLSPVALEVLAESVE